MADDPVQSIVAGRRLTRGTAPRRTFTIERSEARLRLRGRPGNKPWTWTLALLRAGLVLAHEPVIAVTCVREVELYVWTFDLALPGADLGEVELATLLDAAVEPDPGPGKPVPVRARRLLARALNESLAAEPAWAEVITPFAARRCERRAATGARDPYDERVIPTRSEPDRIRMRVAQPVRGLGRVFEALRDSVADVHAILQSMWAHAMPWATDGVRTTTAFALRHRLPGAAVELGTFARWWPLPTQGEVALVRDGLRIAQLDGSLAQPGLPSAMLRGYIECDALHLTVDEQAVVEDGAFDELAGWLADAIAHSTPDENGAPQVTWPVPPRLCTVAGDMVSAAALHQLASDGGELLYSPPIDAVTVPESLRTRTLELWPSARAWLQRCYPALQLVPVHGVLAANQVARADLTALAQGSLPGRALSIDPWVHDDAPPLAIDAIALVHAHGVAAKGAVVVLAWERSLGRLADEAVVIPGVTLVARIGDSKRVDALRADAKALRSLAIHVADSARAQLAVLVRHAVTQGGSDAAQRVPLLRHAIASVSAASLDLRYLPGDDGVRLRWRGDPLLELVVAHTRKEAPVTLRAALERARDVGGIVIGEPIRKWFTLEDESFEHATWIPTPDGAELLARLFGRAALWSMPIVPQSMIHVAPAAAQRQLLLEAQEVARLLLSTTTDPQARGRLLGHLLVARAVGEPEQGLADVPLLSTYDPRAVEPARLRSLAALLAEGRPFAVQPTHTATRELVGPIVEAAPGEAALLVEVVGLSTTPTADGNARPRTTAGAPQQRPAGMREPILSVAIVDPLAVGALHLHAEPSESGIQGRIQIWAKSLSVGAFSLPAPLAEVEGRLWLGDAGIRAKHEGIAAVAAREGRALVATAVRQVALAPPGSQRRRALERFLGHCRAAIAEGRDRFGLQGLLAVEAAPAVLRAEHALPAKLPPLRRLWLPGIVRHALGKPTSIETAWLSWRAAKLVDPRAIAWTVELGQRQRWNKRALADDASIIDVFLASTVAVADVLAQAEAPRSALAAALLRVLATAHAGPRT